MADKRPNNKRFTHIAIPLEKTLRPFKKRYGDGSMNEIWSLWDKTVGPEIAENAQPGVFRDGTLFVTVTSSPWMQQLQFLKSDIADRLNTAIGTTLIKEIRFRIGNL